MLNYNSFKELTLKGRYVKNSHIIPLAKQHASIAEITKIGSSVQKKPIYSYVFGTGKIKILVWSQMHGNESTTTKALFDFFNRLHHRDEVVFKLLSECTFCVIPILNPDGAEKYTRVNANNIDLNRDAQQLSQPESKVLLNTYKSFKPDYCFNLHGQRTIFSAGYSANSSVLSFLSPAHDQQRSITRTRKVAMEVIVTINNALKDVLPDQISRYDDGFNINCVGDSFQSMNTPTILFEAGHFPGDYKREKTRMFIYDALMTSFLCIANDEVKGDKYQSYFNLPENQKLFFDIIIRNVVSNDGELVDVAIQYEETLKNEELLFVPRIAKVGSLEEYFGHKEIDGGQNPILINNTGKIANSLTIINEISINGVDFVDKIAVS
ncbi:MAG: peptidase M14 [Flavobacteriaceae bacterium]|nr:peptidase M14 [Flavobacteriaceae bacterium]